MKLLLRTTVIIGIFLAFHKSILAFPNKSELLSKLPIHPKRQEYAQLSPKSSDFKLLIQAMRQFLARNFSQIESELNITANFSGGNVSIYTQIKTIMEAPNKFRSEIAFTNANGVIGKQYFVVSNGSQVWIHDSQEEEYSVMDYSSFKESDDNFLIGMLSSLWLDILESTEDLDILRNLPEDQLLEALEIELETDLNTISSGTETVEGNQYTTYTYRDSKQGLTMTAFINPSTAEIELLHLNSLDNGYDMVMEEKVLNKTILPFIPADTFSFVPPVDAQKIDTPVEIEPF